MRLTNTLSKKFSQNLPLSLAISLVSSLIMGGIGPNEGNSIVEVKVKVREGENQMRALSKCQVKSNVNVTHTVK